MLENAIQDQRADVTQLASRLSSALIEVADSIQAVLTESTEDTSTPTKKGEPETLVPLLEE